MRQDRSEQTVSVVTSASLSHTDDLALRQRRYIITQSIRIACVILATALPVPLAWKGVLLFGAIALPWFGVVMANAGPTVARSKKSNLVAKPIAAETVRMAIEPGRVIDAER